MKNLQELHIKAMMEVIDTCTDEVIAGILDIAQLSEFDKVNFKIIALTEIMEIILENYFEFFYENKRLKRKLREKENAKSNL